MEGIRSQREHLGASQKLDRISGGVPTVSGILRSASNPKDKAKSVENYPTEELEDSTIFEGECTCCILSFNVLVSSDLAVSSVSALVRTSISFRCEILREIVRIIF